MEYYAPKKKKKETEREGKHPSVTIWAELKGIIVKYIGQRKINNVRFHLYVDLKKQPKA